MRSASRSTGYRSRIELAAARASVLAPAELLDRLDQRLPCSAAGARPARAPAHHPLHDRVEHAAAHALANRNCSHGSGSSRAGSRSTPPSGSPRASPARRCSRISPASSTAASCGSRTAGTARVLDALDRARVRPRTARRPTGCRRPPRPARRYFVALGDQAEYELEGAPRSGGSTASRRRATTCVPRPAPARHPPMDRRRALRVDALRVLVGRRAPRRGARVDGGGARFRRGARRPDPGDRALLHARDRLLAGPRRVARARAR